MHVELWQWLVGAAAALLIGFSKTGMPGAGILVVPLLAYAFGGRLSVGVMLPMLIFADCFAVWWYRRHAQWDKLLGLLPWVAVGLLLGTVALWGAGKVSGSGDIMNRGIGILVLVMLGLSLLQKKFHGKLSVTSGFGTASTGVAAGFSTMVSNAAGPIMSIYMEAQKLSKNEFMGSAAWYFLIVNVSKMPVYLVLTAINPAKPIVTAGSLWLDAMLFPVILAGVFAGKWLLPRMSQKLFDTVVLSLAAISATKLVIG